MFIRAIAAKSHPLVPVLPAGFAGIFASKILRCPWKMCNRRTLNGFSACPFPSNRRNNGKEKTKKPDLNIFGQLLAASLIIPAVRAFADDNPAGIHQQREELRRDERDIEQLRSDEMMRFARAIGAKRASTTRTLATRGKRLGKVAVTFAERPWWTV